jgi:hypothetical protein
MPGNRRKSYSELPPNIAQKLVQANDADGTQSAEAKRETEGRLAT